MSLIFSMISVSVTTFVERMFCLTLCMCPIVVWIDFGRCFLMPSVVSPGNDDSQLLLIAPINVVTTGAPNEAWWKACRCAADFWRYVLLAVCCSWMYADLGFRFVSDLLLSFLSGINHRFVIASLSPSIITLLSFITCTLCSPNSTWHPASHRTGTDTSDCPSR